MSSLSSPSFSRPEAQLLLCTARPGEARAGRIAELVQQPLDWTFLLRAANWHQISPRLFRCLTPHAEDVPDDVLASLRYNHDVVNRHNLLLTGTLVQLLQAFDEDGISVVPLKGPALATLLYDEPTLRPAADLDLLVPRAQLSRARQRLTEMGYRSEEMTESEEADFVETRLGREYYHPDRPVTVELHWHFLNAAHAFPLDPEAIWQRLDTVELAGQTVQRLSLEDTLLYLCAHGGKHHWEKLKWIIDVAELIRTQPALSWETATRRAEALHSRRMLLLGLHLAAEWLEAPLPQPVAAAARRDDTLLELAAQVQAWLFTEPFKRPESIGAYLFHLRMRERWRDRLPYLPLLFQLAVTPTEKDRAFLDLPDTLSFLYYLVRPVRLLAGGTALNGTAEATGRPTADR